MKEFKLKNGFLLGCATAATQIEGGDKNNSWYDWAERGKIADGSSPQRANDHWNRVEEDVVLMENMGLQIYRMGLEWSRIQPEKDFFDGAAIDHYREELKLLRSKGILPLITLHHFTNPLWFEQSGAFESKSAVEVFDAYVAYVVEQLGDLCSEWITINEPNVYVVNGYIMGEWPPGKKSFRLGFGVFKNLTLCHIRAYRTIHRIRKEKGFEGNGETKVGFANHLRVFDPYRKGNLLDKIGAKTLEYLFQNAFATSMATGKLAFPIGWGAPLGKGRFYDFIGINYYTRSAVKGFADGTMPYTKRNDLDWEIYPEGLSRLIQEQYERFQAPVWITENGIADAKDALRARYIYDHLSVIASLNTPVERYYHWCFMDNFEWNEGESARFGLVEVCFDTQKRTVRKSGRFFGELIQNGGVTEDMIDTYLIDGQE